MKNHIALKSTVTPTEGANKHSPLVNATKVSVMLASTLTVFWHWWLRWQAKAELKDNCCAV